MQQEYINDGSGTLGVTNAAQELEKIIEKRVQEFEESAASVKRMEVIRLAKEIFLTDLDMPIGRAFKLAFAFMEEAEKLMNEVQPVSGE